MTDREKLILHLQNLAKTKVKSATIDVVFLLGILNALPKEQQQTSIRVDKVSLELDGGDFSDN